MNAPLSDEHIFLNEDEKKITYKVDPKIEDAGTFTILKEDHTFGNIVRYSLLRDPRVIFAGYRMPHPLENRLLVKVRTRHAIEPTQVFADHLELLTAELQKIEEQFKAEYAKKNNPDGVASMM